MNFSKVLQNSKTSLSPKNLFKLSKSFFKASDFFILEKLNDITLEQTQHTKEIVPIVYNLIRNFLFFAFTRLHALVLLMSFSINIKIFFLFLFSLDSAYLFYFYLLYIFFGKKFPLEFHDTTNNIIGLRTTWFYSRGGQWRASWRSVETNETNLRNWQTSQ